MCFQRGRWEQGKKLIKKLINRFNSSLIPGSFFVFVPPLYIPVQFHIFSETDSLLVSFSWVFQAQFRLCWLSEPRYPAVHLPDIRCNFRVSSAFSTSEPALFVSSMIIFASANVRFFASSRAFTGKDFLALPRLEWKWIRLIMS